jgi:peptidoglycan hydrolase-like protein with peptidoglycan-binding domain
MSLCLSVVSLVAVSLAVVPPQPARANDAALIIAAGVVTLLIAGSQQRRRPGSGQRSGPSAAEVEANSAVQRALNYFGYEVGTVDGRLGPRSEAAIRRYQTMAGFEPTGKLRPHERDFLLDAMARAERERADGPNGPVLASLGTKGLLRTYRNEALGVRPSAAVPAATRPVTPPVAPPAPPPVAPPVVAEDAPRTVSPPVRPGLDARSMAGFCGTVERLTGIGGGVQTAETLTDPDLALAQEFCTVRRFAIGTLQRQLETNPGVSTRDLEVVCLELSLNVSGIVTDLPYITRDAARAAVLDVLDQTASDVGAEAYAGLAVACTGIGYRVDNAGEALSAALVLDALGRDAYGEAVGHHLTRGFGTEAAPPVGDQWLGATMDALAAGAEPAFLPGRTSDRVALIRAAMAAGGTLPAAPRP